MPAKVLSRGSLDDNADGFKPPSPARTFSEHRSAIAQLLILDHERVVSVDSVRVVLVWNPQTGEVITRHALPATALFPGVFTTQTSGLAYVTHDGDAVAIHALADHRELARVTARELGAVRLALGTPDLTRVLLASDDDLVLLSLADGQRIAKTQVSRFESKVLSIYAMAGQFLVRYWHIAGDMYPMDEEKVFEAGTLEEVWHPTASIDPRAPASSPSATKVTVGNAVRVLIDGRPLPDLVARDHDICVTEWLDSGTVLLTADTSGVIHRWDIDPGVAAQPLAGSQHERAISSVRFTMHGVVSFTATDTKLWRDSALIATLPGVGAPILDEATERLIGSNLPTVTTYSLLDGKSLGSHRAMSAPAALKLITANGNMCLWTVGTRGLTSVGCADSFPNRVVSLHDDRERTLPETLQGILSESAPPIVHAGRLLVTHYVAPTRSLSFDTFAVIAERQLHVDGTCWTALHPDGTLYSAGYSDGQLATWDFFTLEPRRQWTVFDNDDRAIRAAVLLPQRAWCIAAGTRCLRRVALARSLGAPVDCAVTGRVEELVPNAAETRVVVFVEGAAPRVLDVDGMTWIEADDGEIDAARARRTLSPQSAARGFDNAFACDDGRWLVGWSRGLAIIPISLADRALRRPFITREVKNRDAVVAVLVDDTLEQLWMLRKDGALVRTALVAESAIETVATIPNGKSLTSVTPALFAVRDETGALHYIRTTGERVCTVDGFSTSWHAPIALAETAAIGTLPDGSLRVATLPGATYVALRDLRATVEASAVAIAPPFAASRHGNEVLRWDLRTNRCDGAWTASTTLTAIDVRSDGAVLAGEANGTVTLLR